MFRKLLSAVTSTAVVAGLVTAGAVATATPAAAVYTIPPFNQSTDNPPLNSQCGLDFGLVLDSSGSIGDAGIQNLVKASNAFVDALVDTGSKVAVTSFSTSSPGSGGTNLAPTALTSANLVNPIKNSYSGLNSDGWTNWQDGLLKMQNFFPQFSGGAPDLIVFITDGNPNTTNSSGGGNREPDSQATNAAISITNSMKSSGTKMFGVAVGSGIPNLDPIRAVTGTTPYDGTNFKTAGYMTATDYTTLQKEIEKIAADLCGSSLTITKQEKTPASASFVPGSGWSFATTVKIPQAPGKWVLPEFWRDHSEHRQHQNRRH